MERIIVGKNGRIVIPKEIRDLVGIKEGSVLSVSTETHPRPISAKKNELVLQVEMFDEVVEEKMEERELNRKLCQIAEDTLSKTRVFNNSANAWRMKSYEFEVSQEKPFNKVVPNGWGLSIYSVEFLKGEGHGTYIITANGVRRGGFTREKGGNEDGVIFFKKPIYVQENDQFSFEQTYGEGKSRVSVDCMIAGLYDVLIRPGTYHIIESQGEE